MSANLVYEDSIQGNPLRMRVQDMRKFFKLQTGERYANGRRWLAITKSAATGSLRHQKISFLRVVNHGTRSTEQLSVRLYLVNIGMNQFALTRA